MDNKQKLKTWGYNGQRHFLGKKMILTSFHPIQKDIAILKKLVENDIFSSVGEIMRFTIYELYFTDSPVQDYKVSNSEVIGLYLPTGFKILLKRKYAGHSLSNIYRSAIKRFVEQIKILFQDFF